MKKQRQTKKSRSKKAGASASAVRKPSSRSNPRGKKAQPRVIPLVRKRRSGEALLPEIAERALKPSEERAIAVAMRKRLTARFDSAEYSDLNKKHWSHADSLSADLAASAAVRRILRNRCRYEVANNSYANGIVGTLANDCIGTGPRLQMLSEDKEMNQKIQEAFSEWSEAALFAESLRTMIIACAQDGESFGMVFSNPRLPHEVQTDILLLEAEQISSPFGGIIDPDEVDGIIIDRFGNPVKYRVLKEHPGGDKFFSGQEYTVISAENMIHLFKRFRAGQHRGIPWITPALPLFAQLRDYTLAVLSAAEAAADFAGVLYTDAPAGDEAEAVEKFDYFELERNMLLTLPQGWKMGQAEAVQPTTSYAEFKKQILNEIARCLNMPFNIAAGNSEGYNYSSGRLDHQTYYKAIKIIQNFVNIVVLNRMLKSWLKEFALLNGYVDLLQALRLNKLPKHVWFWDGMEHVDPQKESSAAETLLKNNLTTLADEYAKRGMDFEAKIRQRGIEKKMCEEVGIPFLPAASSTKSEQGQDEEKQDEEDVGEEQQKKSNQKQQKQKA